MTIKPKREFLLCSILQRVYTLSLTHGAFLKNGTSIRIAPVSFGSVSRR
jgi:hypothetical protein